MTPTQRDAMTTIRQVIEENARLLGEKPGLRAYLQSDGSVRIYALNERGRVIRGQRRHYSSIVEALTASRTANRRAQRVAAKIADGLTVAAAVRATL